MPLTFYKANPKNTGASCGISFNSKDQCVFFNLKKQVSWDPKKRVGSFWDGKHALIKLSINEVGDVIRVLEQNTDFSAYHVSGEFKTQISFKPYFKEVEQDDELKEVHKGFTLSIYKTGSDENDKTSILIGFTHGEAIALREFLKFSLVHIYSAIYSADKKRAEITAKQREKVIEPPASQQKPVDNDDDDAF
jgi:hypothetical protein